MREHSGTIVVVVARIGPYHVAKIAALAQAHRPGAVTAIEVAASDCTYAWERVGTTPFRRVTLVPDRRYEEVSARRLARAMVEVLDREDPFAVAINGWGFPEARAAAGWCRLRGRVAVLMSDSQAHDAPRTRIKELLKRFVVHHHDSALVAGNSHADYVESLGMARERIAMGYDVVDNQHFSTGATLARSDSSLRRRLDLPQRYFVSVARFVEKKNLSGLLREYAQFRLLAGRDAWDLVLLGDGPLRSDLEQLRDSLGLRDFVAMPGFKQYNDLPAFYGLAVAFVIASTSEPWGLVVNEAMAASLPILVSDRCGAVELVQNEVNGWRFDPAIPGQLARAMLQLSRLGPDGAARFGVASHQIISAHGPGRFATGLLRAIELGRARCELRSPSRVAAWLLGA